MTNETNRAAGDMVSVPRELLNQALENMRLVDLAPPLQEKLRAFFETPAVCKHDGRRFGSTCMNCGVWINRKKEMEDKAAAEDVRAMMDEPACWVHPTYLKRRDGCMPLAIDATLDQIASAQVPLYLHAQRNTKMPERMPDNWNGNRDYMDTYNVGWNACLDELKCLNGESE